MNINSIAESVVATLIAAVLIGAAVWLYSWLRNCRLEAQLTNAINPNGAGVRHMQIDVPVRHEQLVKLEESLEALCELLRLDTQCIWTKHFQTCLATVRELIGSGFDQTALHDLSSSIRYVFGGMGSFNDYMPIMNTKESSAWYQKHGNPEEVIGIVYSQAMDLIVVGERNG